MQQQRLIARVSGTMLMFAFVCGMDMSAQQVPVVTDAQPQDALVVLQLGACEGRCPVYKLVVFADATTIFEGRFNVRKPGVVRGKIPRDSLGKILKEAKSMHFFDLKSRYVPGALSTGNNNSGKETAGECVTPKSNASTAILTISANGRTQTVTHFRGCAGADALRLTQFEDRIVAAANISKFIR